MDLRMTAAILAGKITAAVIKLFGGGATTAPGLLALYIDPDLVKKLSKKIKNGSIVISGTNGKTTTARLVFNILSTKFKVIHNRQGSNLLRGIAATLLQKSTISGSLAYDLAIWEVDEATVPEAIDNVSCQTLVLINLMRDQLDRYGEVDTVRDKWRKTIEQITKNTTLVLNTDDPGISILAKNYKGSVVYFGVNQTKLDLPPVESVADVRLCLNCHYPLKYTTHLSAHMGHYYCPNCHLKRPNPDVSAGTIKFNSDFSTTLKLNVKGHPSTPLRIDPELNRTGQMSNVSYQLPGLYNVYNVIAAYSLGRLLNIDSTQIKKTIESFGAAFGRFQRLKVKGKNIIIFLIKNPAGANEVLRTISKRKSLNVLAVLNDNIADGRDVSWIWDTNWEILTGKIKTIGVSGTRAWDLGTRFKYSGIKLSKNDICKEISYSILKSLENLNKKDTLLILPTYTALLEVQKSLSTFGATTKWHEQ